jgi:hypothetical protein
MWLVALAAVVAVTAACGGQPAEETPAEEPAPAEEAAPEPEATPTTMPAAVPEETPEPEPQQQLMGTIVEIESEHDMGWNSAATREQPGEYYWVVQLRNDTTQTLDITVTFQFLDDQDNVIKTDRETVRVDPAGIGNFRVTGEMERDNARAVASYTYSWDWDIVEG